MLVEAAGDLGEEAAAVVVLEVEEAVVGVALVEEDAVGLEEDLEVAEAAAGALGAVQTLNK